MQLKLKLPTEIFQEIMQGIYMDIFIEYEGKNSYFAHQIGQTSWKKVFYSST